jgi:GT2 family glycosyltransferase
VIVVDQGHGDGARRAVEAARAAGLRVRLIEQRKRGLAVSQNAAIGAAGTDVVAVTDDDCVADDAWLAVVRRAFEADRELGLLTGRVLPLPTEAKGLVPVSTRTSATPVAFSGPTDPWEIGSGNNFAVRRKWFDAVGGCDERLGPGAAGRGALDMDLFYRLVRAGAPARYEPEAVVFHEQKARRERRSRRPDYGFGMGVCCMFWRKDGDLEALAVLRRWLRSRGRSLFRAARRGQLRGAYDEALMLIGTLLGIVHGSRHAR